MNTHALILDMYGTTANSVPRCAQSGAAAAHCEQLLDLDFLENLHAATT